MSISGAEKGETLQAIYDRIAPLERDAKDIGMPTLAYFLSMARLEAGASLPARSEVGAEAGHQSAAQEAHPNA